MSIRSVVVRLRLDNSGFNRGLAQSAAAARAFTKNLDEADNRMSGIVQTGLALGPALVPAMGAAAVGAVGVASALGAAATGAGVAALAFNGVGDALTAVNDYALDPTAENLEEMRAKLRELGPAGADFVRFLQSMRPQIDGLQSIARQGLLPGVEDGIREVSRLFPQFEQIVANVSTAMGDLARSGGDALNDPFWRDFFTFIAQDAGAALEGMGQALGNVAQGFAGITMAVDPLADDFGRQLIGMSEAFAQWGRELGQSQGFREFADYVRSVGPQLGDTLGAIANALVQFGQAAAPVGQGVLVAVEGIANALAVVANIPLVGPALIGAAAGVAALSRAVALWNATGMASLVTGLRGVDSEGKKASTAMTAIGRGGVALAGIGIGVAAIEQLGSALDETLPGINELQDSLTELGSGGALATEFDSLGESIRRMADPDWAESTADFLDRIGLPSETEMRQARAEVGALDTALAQLAAQEGPEAARQAFQDLIRAQDLSGSQARQLVELLPQYRDALAGVGSDADLAAEGLTRAEQAASNLNSELANLSANLERRGALRAYRDSIRDFNEGLKEGPKNLRQGSAAWDEQMGKLDGIAAASVAAADKLRGLNKIRFMQQAREDFIGAAERMGMTAKQAERLADRLGLVNQKGKIQITLRSQGMDKATQDLARLKDAADRVPKRIDARVKGDTGDADRDLGVIANKMRDLDNKVAKPKAQVEDKASPIVRAITDLVNRLDRIIAAPTANVNDNASPRINTIAGMIAALDGRTATVTIQTREITTQITNVLRNIVPGAGGAEGMMLQSYAAGDVRNGHQPEIARPGTWRLWAEDETGGESYIPHANDHRRARAIDIWERTGDILGVKFARLAEGGMTEKERLQAIREHNRALQSGLREFRPADDRQSMRSELHDLIRVLREELGRGSPIIDRVDRLGDHMVGLAKQLDRNAKAQEKLGDEFRDLRQARSGLASTVAGNFRSDEAFAGGAADLSLWLRANRNDARRMEAALRGMRRRGASDALIREVAESGNFTLAQELASRGRRQLNQYDRLLGQRNRAARGAGAFAGAAVFGDDMRKVGKSIDRLERTERRLERRMGRFDRRIERSVERGTRAGNRASNRAGGARTRARSGGSARGR